MGQSSSRHQNPIYQSSSSSSNAVAGASTDPLSENAGNAEGTSPRASRRNSIRKSFLNLVKPSGIRSRVSSTASNSAEHSRSWRNSRRWSKAPQDNVTSNLPSSSGSSTPTSPVTSNDKGKQPEHPIPEKEDLDIQELSDQPITPTPIPSSPLHDTSIQEEENGGQSSTINAPHSSSTIHYTSIDHQGPSLEDTSESVMNQEPPSPIPAVEIPANLPPPPQLTQQSPQHNSPSPRQFPPPGTLVVVQGIVHTTDVSRTNSDPPASLNQTQSTPSFLPPSTHGPSLTPDNINNDPQPIRRNRLSALLRPRSAASRPTSAHVSDPPSISVTPPAEQDDASQTPLTEDLARTRSTTPVIPDADEPQNQSNPVDPPIDNRSSISSSSIDVLGTLLSVAAAATAASLLTGSSEPILSSGLAPPNSSSPLPAPVPSSPPPTYPPSPTTNVPMADVSAAGRAERMRQAWGTIRERLGLRPSSPPIGDHFNTQRSPLTEGTTSPSTPADARELMLAEMARAFNIGLGLNGLSGASTPPASAPHEAGPTDSLRRDDGSVSFEGASTGPSVPPLAQSPSLPPEGSFERFLVDLQLDLRTALTRPGEEEAHNMPLPPSHASTSSLHNTEPSIPGNGDSQTPWRPEHFQHSEGSDHQNIPEPQSVSDSDSEFHDGDIEDSDDEEHEDFHSAQASDHGLSTPLDETAQPSERQSTNVNGRIDASGRINWWRLYRFPPITSPRVDPRQPSSSTTSTSSTLPPSQSTISLPVDATPSPQVPFSGSNGNLASPLEPSTSPSDSSPSSPSTTSIPQSPISTTNTTTLPAINTVVPVIVVGLQSVNTNWRPDTVPGENDGIDIFGHHNDNATADNRNTNHTPHMHDHPDNEDFEVLGGGRGGSPLGNHPQQQNGARTRGWQHRAANAFRNLRPGRRTPTAGAPQPTVPTGSRTFLIYVIGGYYPPDHSIVTGGPNNLDSFEALLELADLLGQVKPPTVSKDDIEKSGLKIIKMDQLAQYEDEGKIASNCVERCLICLDDYTMEQDIRVMSCRHAFHQGCVDEWLQKGRNNCPACRTTGVNLDAAAAAATSS